jgi:serine/threonine protein kinase
LEKYLRLKGRFTENDFKPIFRQIYGGYQSFLQAGFIHRDLKPANIFIKGDQIKIADFGMVKKLSENPRDNYNVGTPVYMPP